tara:strand:- start:153 stop:938 length:786 start_codon:yes stop_codon:yes gene_type:complete
MGYTSDFWDKIDSWGGPTFGVILVIIGAYLMFRGAKKIKVLSFLTGCAIGNLSSAIIYKEVGDLIPYPESDVTIGIILAFGLLMFTAVNLLSLAITAYISLQTMLFIISILESHGYDSGTEVMGGILVGISFLIRRYMRKNLYLFGSSALGTLFVIYGYFIMNGQIPSDVVLTDMDVQLIGLALFINAVLIQTKLMKDVRENEFKAEMQGEVEKQNYQRQIDNDAYGRGRYLQPDILTQAALEENQNFDYLSYDLNRSRRY